MNKLYKYSLKAFHLTENTIAVIVLCLLSLVPVVEIIARSFFKTGLYGSTEYVQHLVIWITFVGGMFASREKRHLSVALGAETFPAKIRPWISTFAAFLSVGIVSGLAIASYIFITVGMDPTQVTGIIKTQYITFIMPLGFALMALRFIGLAPKSFVYRFIATLGFGLPFLFIYILMPHINLLAWPLGIILGLSLVCGTPIFVVLGGIAQLVLLSSGGETATLANEAYSMLTGPLMPTIPLFSLAGYILSESKAGERLVRLFQACFGWMSGGLTIMAIMVSAFFTTFTGASGVTVIALGGLLTFILMKSGYQRGFSLGFVTASGSLGLLFPPSIAVILYGVVSHVNIRHMFVAGLLPVFLLYLLWQFLEVYVPKRAI